MAGSLDVAARQAPASTVVPVREPTRFGAARRARWLFGSALLIALAGTALLPWEWSFIDDGDQLTRLHSSQAAHGPVAGVLSDVLAMYRTDLSWGLFRPAFWVFGATFYLLPVEVAHAVRIAMLLCAFAGPLVIIGRTFAGRPRLMMVIWTGAALAASGSIYMGIWYPSLQELSGLAFVGLGLLAGRHPLVRVVCWLVAAWFKAPFSWLLIAHGVVLCRRRETRALGMLAALFGVGTLLATAYLIRTGTYTAALSFTPGRIRGNLQAGVGALAAPLAVLLAGLLALRPRIDVTAEPTALVLLAGGGGYLASLLAWKTNGYYASPYVYLLTVGALLAVRGVGLVSRARLVAGLLVPLLLSGFYLAEAATAGGKRLATVTGLRDCVLGLPDGVTVGYNRHEAWERLDYIVREHRPGWRGRIALVDPGLTTGSTGAGAAPRLDYYIYERGAGAAAPSLVSGPVVCRTPDATVYRVLASP
jgi:hypothetical protein